MLPVLLLLQVAIHSYLALCVWDFIGEVPFLLRLLLFVSYPIHLVRCALTDQN